MKRKRNSKASKHCEVKEKVDRLSKLPDELIHQILSFIDMRYAVQTTVLSKRWRNVWMSLPFITVDIVTYIKEQMKLSEDKFESSQSQISSFCENLHNRCVDFVNKVFEFRDESDIRLIRLGLGVLNDISVEALNGWMLEAVNHNVQDLILNVAYFSDSGYAIPHHLLNCRSLKELDVTFADYTDIILPKSMSLPQVNTLALQGISISNSELNRLFSSCPLTEVVHIQKCDIQTSNQRNIIIDSHSLQLLGLTDNRHTNLGSTEDLLTCTSKICAPNAKGLFYTGFMTEDVSLENLSSLDGAQIDIRLKEKEEEEEEDYEEEECAQTYSELTTEEKEVFASRMLTFLEAVRNVRHLQLSSGFLEVLLQAPGRLYLRPPQLCNLKSLDLEMRFTRGCLRSIAYLLKISPVLKGLILTSKESNLADVGDDWEADFSLTRMSSHLKYVEIREVEGYDNELKFLRCLLKNSVSLQNLTLIFKSTSDTPYRGRHIRQFKKNIKELPTGACITFEDDHCKLTRRRH